MEPEALIRISVLSELLAQTLEGLEDESLRSAQLLDELRALGERAAQELDQLRGPSGE
jgi:hypothetical protein